MLEFTIGVLVGLVVAVLARDVRGVVRLARSEVNPPQNPPSPIRRNGRFVGTPKATTRKPAAPQPRSRRP